MLNNLAIVIPAFKDVYLEKTLDSLSQQVDKSFTVYIGDDNNPYGLDKIISKYSKQLDIIYTHFDTNLGGINLVQQWNRCLRLVRGEEFFCLFSDDDIMHPMCIKSFNEELKTHNDFDVYHFDIDIIDSEGSIVEHCNEYSSWLSSEEFLSLLYRYQIDARMPEFIFRTHHFYKSGGFVNFDQAFRSDNATVVTCGKDRGIYTIPNAKVLWRDSGINVSSAQNANLKIRRMYANIDFFNWLECYYVEQLEECPLDSKQRIKLVISNLVELTDCLSRKDLYKALRKVNKLKCNYLLYLRYKLSLMNRIRREGKWTK